MQIPFNAPLRIYRQQEKEILAAVQRVLESGHYILGPENKALEEEFAKTQNCTASQIVACNSGTDAIILGLKVLGVKPEDEVITVSHTAIPTIVAIRSTGATPIFVDIDPETWVMDVKKAQAAVGKKTKAIITVHLYGNMVALEKNSFSVPVLEDVAQAMGSQLHGEIAGTLGDAGAFSFYPTKNIGALGDGGALFCKENSASEMGRMLRNYGQKDRYNALYEGGLNSRLDEIQAAILRARLKMVQSWDREKADTVSFYRESLKETPLRFQKITPGCRPAWHLAVAKTENAAQREKLQQFLEKQGVQTLVHYPIPTHQQKAFAAFHRESLPITEDLAESILSLPLYPGLTVPEKEHIVSSIQTFYR